MDGSLLGKAGVDFVRTHQVACPTLFDREPKVKMTVGKKLLFVLADLVSVDNI